LTKKPKKYRRMFFGISGFVPLPVGVCAAHAPDIRNSAARTIAFIASRFAPTLIPSQAAAGRYKLAGPFVHDGQIRVFSSSTQILQTEHGKL